MNQESCKSAESLTTDAGTLKADMSEMQPAQAETDNRLDAPTNKADAQNGTTDRLHEIHKDVEALRDGIAKKIAAKKAFYDKIMNHAAEPEQDINAEQTKSTPDSGRPCKAAAQ